MIIGKRVRVYHVSGMPGTCYTFEPLKSTQIVMAVREGGELLLAEEARGDLWWKKPEIYMESPGVHRSTIRLVEDDATPYRG